MEHINYLRLQSASKRQTMISALLHRAVRRGVLRTNPSTMESNRIAYNSSMEDATAVDDQLIRSNSIGEHLWCVIQSVLEEHFSELQNAVALIAMHDAKPNEVKRVKREVVAVVRRLLSSSQVKGHARIIPIIAFSSVLAQTISTTHGCSVMFDVVHAIEEEIHKDVREGSEPRRLQLPVLGLLGMIILSYYILTY